MWEHRNYDPTYMGMEPERSFDHPAWKRAGRPMGDALAAWEEAWFSSELPAREALRAAERELALARHELEEAAAGAATPTGAGEEAVQVARARVRLLMAHVATERARLDVAHGMACKAAGMSTDTDTADRALSDAERVEHEVERWVRESFDGPEADAIIVSPSPRG